ncbi:MAG: GAF domain-containing SpoIIE family protein phosphatase [bacterium]
MKNINLKDIEKSFDTSWNRIINILGEVFNTEVALINSVEGLELEVLKTKPSRGNPFTKNEIYDLTSVYCDKVVKGKKGLEINNATADRGWDNYKGIDYGLISYLGYPIFNPQGEVVGTICVEDKKERYFEETEKELLLQFKEVIENQLQQIDLTKKLEDNLEKGRKLHKQTLPARMPEIDNISFGTFYQAADRLGGDFYDVIELEDNLLFYVSDVSGHDLSSSMLNIFLKEAISSYLIYQQDYSDYLSPSRMIDYISERFEKKDFPVDYFISLIIGVISLNNYQITLSNAGFQFPPLISQKNGEVFALNCIGMPITIDNNYTDYNEYQYNLQPEDILHVSTDGLFEQKNNNNDMYGENRVREIISNNSNLRPESIVNKIYNDFLDFKEDMPIQDDLTSLLIKRNC